MSFSKLFKQRLGEKIGAAKHRYIDEPATEKRIKQEAYAKYYEPEARRQAALSGKREAFAKARARYSTKKKKGGGLGGLFGGDMFTFSVLKEGKSRKKSIWD